MRWEPISTAVPDHLRFSRPFSFYLVLLPLGYSQLDLRVEQGERTRPS